MQLKKFRVELTAMTKLKIIAALLCLTLAQAETARAKVTCITRLTGQSVCTDDRTGRTYEKVDKLTNESEWVITWPGRGGRSYDNDHNEDWNGRGRGHGNHED